MRVFLSECLCVTSRDGQGRGVSPPTLAPRLLILASSLLSPPWGVLWASGTPGRAAGCWKDAEAAEGGGKRQAWLRAPWLGSSESRPPGPFILGFFEILEGFQPAVFSPCRLLRHEEGSWSSSAWDGRALP